MNRQSRDIATLGTQDKKKEDKQITKTKQKTKMMSNTVATKK